MEAGALGPLIEGIDLPLFACLLRFPLLLCGRLRDSCLNKYSYTRINALVGWYPHVSLKFLRLPLELSSSRP